MMSPAAGPMRRPPAMMSRLRANAGRSAARRSWVIDALRARIPKLKPRNAAQAANLRKYGNLAG
jgi:hypothetical protein